MDASTEGQYHALLSLAEGFRTSDPPDMWSCMQCLMAVLNLLPAGCKYLARTNLQIGRVMLREGVGALDYARSYLEKSLQCTRDHPGDGQVEQVKLEAASLLALVYEKQGQGQGCVNLLTKCLEHSSGHMGFHCRLLLQLAHTYAKVGEYGQAAAVLSTGAEYASSDPQLRILFLLSSGMMRMVSVNGNESHNDNYNSVMGEVRQVLHSAWTLIESAVISPMRQEGLKVFFLLLQVCHLLNSGQVKSVKTPLKSLQLAIQTMSQTCETTVTSESAAAVGDRFQWLHKEHMCILVYVVTVLHSVQAGYMDKAEKYSEKALMQIQQRLSASDGPANEEDEEEQRLLSSFQLILLEHMAMCRLVTGQRSLAMRETVQALHLSRRMGPGLETRHKPVIRTLLGLYAMSMNQMGEAEKQLSAVLRSCHHQVRVVSPAT